MKKFFRIFTIAQVLYHGYQMLKDRKSKKQPVKKLNV
ncbi:hypothetical protein SAMN05421855_101263 [Ulvibacter litoralis]|uniref:Uncharacterized protein n=1 Tax=Ulvibacter litoralis TaxID=227084 RepID=A0A1G7CBF1_9FLAO|nr:hypothetical protein SAMN05421855_101263 [Ulvibacter litoralis]